VTIDDDVLISYALGTLASEEERELEAHLRAHPEDAEKVRGYLEALADFALELPPEPLPAEGEEALLERVREADPPPVITMLGRPRRLWWLALGAAAAVLIGVYLTVLAPPSPEERIAAQLQEFQNQPGAVTYELVRNTEAGPGEPIGTLVRLPDNRLFVALESPPAESQVYQAWEIRGDTPVSLGTFEDRAFLTERVSPESVFGVTLEPPGGSEQPTSTPITLVELQPSG